jgi:hypothetical protein
VSLLNTFSNVKPLSVTTSAFDEVFNTERDDLDVLDDFQLNIIEGHNLRIQDDDELIWNTYSFYISAGIIGFCFMLCIMLAIVRKCCNKP